MPALPWKTLAEADQDADDLGPQPGSSSKSTATSIASVRAPT